MTDKQEIEITYTDTMSVDIDCLRAEGQEKYESERGIICGYHKFLGVAKNKSGDVVGLIEVYTAFAEVYIDDLWVDEKYRGLGYGRQLLHTLEENFKGKGYNNINCCSSAFQAPEFYKKCGFQEEFVRINKQNPQFNKTFLVKYFDDEIQTEGLL